MRPVWKGSLSFALVNIPIKLYTATSPKEIRFKTLCGVCHTPIMYKKWCPNCNEEAAEVKKGYKIAEGDYVIVEDEDFERIKLKSSKVIELTQFVDKDKLPSVYYEKSFYLAPEESAVKVYSLFHQTLLNLGKLGIGTVTMRNREYTVAVEAYQHGLVMHTLYYATEVKPMDELKELKELAEPGQEELQLAEELIGRMTNEKLDLQKYKDKYTEALKELIRAKAAGEIIKIKEYKEERKEEVGLMETLKASLESIKK